jgi:hypothetical protein
MPADFLSMFHFLLGERREMRGGHTRLISFWSRSLRASDLRCRQQRKVRWLRNSLLLWLECVISSVAWGLFSSRKTSCSSVRVASASLAISNVSEKWIMCLEISCMRE